MLEKSDFDVKMKELAGLMGYELVLDGDYKYERRAKLVQGFDEIHLSNGGYRAEDKITISGSFPRTKTGEMGYIYPPKPIQVSDRKTAEQISKDIARRYLPEYRINLDKALRQINATDDAEEQAKKDIDAIKAAYPKAQVIDHENKARRSVVYLEGRSKIEIAYNGNGKHRIELDKLSTEQVISILAMIQ
jgi:hypothetical protein